MIDYDKPPLNRYDFSRLENMWLPLILDVIKGMIERWEMCECHDCVLDTVALALNSLPPKYWVGGKYDAFMPPDVFLADANNRLVAEQAVIKALSLVSKNPHH